MGYLKIVAYVYLAVGAFFVYSGIQAMQEGEDGYFMFGLAAVAVFMFFFRLRYAKKFHEEKSARDNRKKDI